MLIAPPKAWTDRMELGARYRIGRFNGFKFVLALVGASLDLLLTIPTLYFSVWPLVLSTVWLIALWVYKERHYVECECFVRAHHELCEREKLPIPAEAA